MEPRLASYPARMISHQRALSVWTNPAAAPANSPVLGEHVMHSQWRLNWILTRLRTDDSLNKPIALVSALVLFFLAVGLVLT